ncbi:hypothetical protein OIE66_28575 [Nonomuraea sp. NBC_01738]|nr:hypothetical protein OIE66_28575 [Nonomuraea sp. NBC_01738]
MSPTPKGRAPEARPIWAVSHSGVAWAAAPIVPRAPAAETAAAKGPAPTPAIGAATTGSVRPKRSVSQVLITRSTVQGSAVPARGL